MRAKERGIGVLMRTKDRGIGLQIGFYRTRGRIAPPSGATPPRGKT